MSSAAHSPARTQHPPTPSTRLGMSAIAILTTVLALIAALYCALAKDAAGATAEPSPRTFVKAISTRRSIYALSDKPILSTKDLIDLVQETVRQSPSAFNSQSSRAVILLGAAHKKFWLEQIKAWGQPDVVGYMAERLLLFAAGEGTVLFFEDQSVIKGMQEKNAAFAPAFPGFSSQSSGMAQINTWTALATAGYGANLQHIGAISGPSYVDAISKEFGFPATWSPMSELVFGSIEKPAGDKSFIDNNERFKIVQA